MYNIFYILGFIAIAVIIYLIWQLNQVQNAKDALASNFIQELDKLKLYNDQLRKIIEDENHKYNVLKNSIPNLIKSNRQDAVETSRVVLKGKISEEFIPFMLDFPFKISDGKFFGSPIDFIWFNGLSEGLVTNVVFMDVKTGGAKLTNTQKQIKQAIEEGKVSWETYVRK